MTTFTEVDVRCAVCGALARKAELSGTSSFGVPDLDLRPYGPARWALPFRVQRCDECGYCARSLGIAPPGIQEVVESPVYRGVLTRSRLPKLARSYFCAALVNDAAGRHESAGWRFLDAAWVCDDRHARAQARACRERAAEMFERALADGDTGTDPAVLHAVTADVWRRAGRFDRALAACDAADAEIDADDEDDNGAATVSGFIRALALQGDDEPRNSAEAFADDS